MNDTDKNRGYPAKRGGNGCLTALVSVVVVFVGLYAAAKIAQRPNYRTTFYAVVTLDATVNGYPVHLERTINCQSFPVGNPDNLQISFKDPIKTLFSPRATQTFAIPAAFGHVLPDGSALMVQTPYHCGREFIVDESGAKKLRVQDWGEPRIPVMGWSPDGEKVKTFEIYVSDSFMTDPEARIQDLKVNVELVSNPPPAIVDNFAWFSGLYHSKKWIEEGPKEDYGFDRDGLDGRGIFRRHNFSGYGGWVLEESGWRGLSAELDAHLDSLQTPSALPIKFSSDIEKVFSRGVAPSERPLARYLPYHTGWKGLRYRMNWSPPTIEGFAKSPFRNHSLAGFASSGDRTIVDQITTKGVLTLRDGPSRRKTLRHISPDTGESYRIFELAGHAISDSKLFFRVFYDPKSKKLYLLRNFSFVTAAPIGSPILDNS